MSNHAKLSASGSHRWMNCPGSIRMEEGFEDKGSKFAAEGTAAHFLGAECLEQDKDPKDYEGKFIRVLSNGDGAIIDHPVAIRTVKDPFEVDDEMIDNVATYVDAIRAAKGHDKLLIEQRLDFSDWVPDGFGTADAVIIRDGVIEIHDLKYGKGVMVHAQDNYQLLLYALGAYAAYSVVYSFDTIRLVIHQPRLQHLSEASITVDALLAFAGTVEEAAKQALQPDAPCVAGEVQCKWCKAKAVCSEAARLTANTVGMTFENLTEDDTPLAPGPEFVTNEQLPNVFAKLDFIRNWCDAVHDFMLEELTKGSGITGYKLVAGRMGNRAWGDKAEAEKMMKSMRLKHDEMYTDKLISPTDADRLLKKKSPKRWARISKLITRSEGKPAIAPESDKRPALPKPGDAFNDLDEGFDDLMG